MLSFCENNGLLQIEEFCVVDGDTDTPTSGHFSHNESKQLCAVYSKMQCLDRSHEDLISSIKKQFSDVSRKINVLHHGIRSVGILPHLCRGNVTGNSVY